MKEEITQVKFSKEYDGKEVSVVCTRDQLYSWIWKCNFNKISLLNIAHIVFELFNSSILGDAKLLQLHVNDNYRFSVEKSTENNTFTHYLEEIASKWYVG
ncbi:MAG: hypothetical protein IJE68_02040 [Clostridia bacterium]|nr:hypothetical protein [Clostridia bacterium]